MAIGIFYSFVRSLFLVKWRQRWFLLSDVSGFTQRTKIAFPTGQLEAIRVAHVSTWITSPGLQQMSTCLMRKKRNSSVMYQCIAVETGKLTNYFILYLTVDSIDIILGFSNIMYQPNWSFNILPPGTPPRAFKLLTIGLFKFLASGQKSRSNAPPIRTEIPLLKVKFLLQANTVHAFQREICRNDTFKLLLKTLLRELFTNKGERGY